MSITIQPFFTPEGIEAESFAIIDCETGAQRPFSGRAWSVARRLIHTTADFDIMNVLAIDEAAIDAGIAAIRRGAPIFTDTEMARSGMTRRHLAPFGIEPQCLLNLPGTAERARERNSTRSRAAIELAGDMLDGAILAVGNAPTALLALLELLQAHAPALKPGPKPVPALVLAMPVGFVNAAESKELFMRYCAENAGTRTVPACIAITGRKGGSTLTAATINALANLAKEEHAA